MKYFFFTFIFKTGEIGNEFPCSDVPPGLTSNVTELQFCDEAADCGDGSDEPPHCSTGYYAIKKQLKKIYLPQNALHQERYE